MSIETLIAEHTKALYAIADAIKGLHMPTGIATTPVGVQSVYDQVHATAPVAQEEVSSPAKKAKPVAKAEKNVAQNVADKEEIADVVAEPAIKVSYAEVRDQVKDKATTKGKQIRAIFELHGITNLRELLSDQDNMDSEVNDLQKLADIHAALEAL